MRKLHWIRDTVGLSPYWRTEEQFEGTPDFKIVKQGQTYRLKMRTSAQWTIHDSLTDAKDYAASI